LKSLPLSIVSLNVNGVNKADKLNSILHDFALPHGITFLQETMFSSVHASATAEYKWRQLTLGRGHWLECPPRYPTMPHEHSCRGVATAIHPDVPISNPTIVPQLAPALHNRYLLVTGTIGGHKVYLHNIQAPSEPDIRSAFFAALPSDLDTNATHIVGGISTSFFLPH